MKKQPAVIEKWIVVEGFTEDDLRQYILQSLEMFGQVLDKNNTNEAGWIAFKLSCSTREAQSAIRWARQ